MNLEITRHYRFNMAVNLMDGAFFGFAIGFASFVTILPLFVNTMTDSAILIGLIPSIHSAGWQFPQFFLANRVSRQKRYKPMTLALTLQERIPFLGLALVSWLIPGISTQIALLLTFFLITWQGLGAGFTAISWQSLIAKIIPSDRRGTFFGLQSSAANLLASISAILAGLILENLDKRINFGLCFLLCSIFMVVSWVFLALTREPDNPPEDITRTSTNLFENAKTILRGDRNFVWFLLARFITQFAMMGPAFYTVYVVNSFHVSKTEAGLMTSVLLGTQIAVNPLMGWLSDRWSHRRVMEIGILAAVISSLLAWTAPKPDWFYPIFILFGIANVANWTIGIIMSFGFSSDVNRPSYIGLSNTLIAPANVLAPFLGGWIADTAGYPVTFLITGLMGGITLLVFHFLVVDPVKRTVPKRIA